MFSRRPRLITTIHTQSNWGLCEEILVKTLELSLYPSGCFYSVNNIGFGTS